MKILKAYRCRSYDMPVLARRKKCPPFCPLCRGAYGYVPDFGVSPMEIVQLDKTDFPKKDDPNQATLPFTFNGGLFA